MGFIFLGLALICLTGAGVDCVPQPFPDTTPELEINATTLPDNTTDEANNTVGILQITDYHYFNWPKIGYHIFLQKMIDAFKTLRFFMSLDPMILKITRTYLLTNDTDYDYDDNSTDVNGNSTSDDSDQSLETNTESPLLITLFGDSEELNDNKTLGGEGLQKSPSDEQKDSVKKDKKETGGFFSSITGAVSSVYHLFTDWF